MSRDIDAIVKGFKNNQITDHLKASHAKLHSLLKKLKKVEVKLDATSTQAKDLKENLHNGHRFMDAYEKLFSNLPLTLVSLKTANILER